MPDVSLLIKPVSGLCNMRCRYCFYRDETEKRAGKKNGIMNSDVMRALITAALAEAGETGRILFSFQGGEPTLAGLDYFRNFKKTVDKLNGNSIPVSWSLQTNGLILDEAWAEFLSGCEFLVGLSLDGTRPIHDKNRVAADGSGTWERVREKADLLLRYRIQTNLLAVVTDFSAKNPEKVYTAMKETGIRYFQFIPCLDPLTEEEGVASDTRFLSSERYGTFLCRLFDLWYRDWLCGDYISIRYFEDIVLLMLRLSPGTCSTLGKCGSYFVVEADGSVYPCDFYALDSRCLGNIMHDTFRDIRNSDREKSFLAESRAVPKECALCPWEKLCGGGCRRDRIHKNGEVHNIHCEAWKAFFAYTFSRFSEIADRERQARFQAAGELRL